MFAKEGINFYFALYIISSSHASRKIKHLRCKHVGALLVAIIALKLYSDQEEPPKDLKRKNVKRFENCSESVRNAVQSDLGWPALLENLLLEPDKKRPGASNNDKILTAPKQPKAKTKKHYATLEDTPVKELQKILRSINPNLRTTGKKKELIERIQRHRPIAPSIAVAQPDVAEDGLTALDMVAKKTKKTKRQDDADAGPKSVSKRTKREIENLTLETARFMRHMNNDQPREKKVSSRLTYPNVK